MRKTSYEKLDPMFIERWSPRAFSPEPLDEDDINTLFEAARWSPSCFNEQPWRFVYANNQAELERFASILSEGNQVWAKQAPMLVIAFSKKHFTHNDKPNRWADFDTGAAWMALTLQANKLGLFTHGMGGFDAERAYQVSGLSAQEYNALCVIAVGRMGDAASLPEDVQAREVPSERKAMDEIIFKGGA